MTDSGSRRFGAQRFEGVVQSEIRRMTFECERVGGLNLAQGVCDLPVPEPVLAGAEVALRGPTNTYAKAPGIPELRRAIAGKLERDNQLRADPDGEIVVTPGVTGAYFATLSALLDPGDGILLFEPFYAYHRNIARSLDLRVQTLRLDPAHARVEEAALRDALDERTRAILVCTPSNPAGKVFARDELAAIARVAHDRDLLVITDEIYEYFVYDGHEHVSPASVEELWPRTVSLMGYSKTFAITGWRIGYAVAPRPLAERVLIASDLYFICANHPLQCGVVRGIEALEKSWYQELAANFQSKRDRICASLVEAGFAPVVPQGSYYAFTDVGVAGFATAREAAMDLLVRTGVATVPGSAFFAGPAGERFLRVCFAKPDDVIDEACARIRALGPPA